MIIIIIQNLNLSHEYKHYCMGENEITIVTHQSFKSAFIVSVIFIFTSKK